MRSARTLTAIALVAVGCSARHGGGRPDAGPAFDAGAGVDAQRADAPAVDSGPDVSDVLVYAHSRDSLFTFSPTDLRVTLVGAFHLGDGSAAPFMLNLAVDSEGNVFTSSDTSLYRVNPETAEAALVGDFGLGSERLYALSFLAPGEYGDGEPLIGATNAGAYYLVDTTSAAASYLGSYPDGWLSSGDIVSVAGLGTFATVRRDDFPSDVLVQILFAADGSSTATVKGPIASSSRNYIQVFGVGYWGRALYGFSNAGELLEIDRDTGAGRLVTTETGTDQFWGAGVTTRAPVLF